MANIAGPPLCPYCGRVLYPPTHGDVYVVDKCPIRNGSTEHQLRLFDARVDDVPYKKSVREVR